MTHSSTASPTAAALVIGNELLSGKVEDANIFVLARRLRSLGIELRRVVMVLDDVDSIAREVRALSESHDWLFTSGGVGPTHDDVTVKAVAQAFDVPVIEDPALVAMLREHYKERCTAGHLQMALVPLGAHLESTESVRWPTIRYRNTWLLPGIPEIFRVKLGAIAERLGAGAAFITRAVFTQMDEGHLKDLLDAVVAAHPGVDVGSYPKWQSPAYKTKITFDGRDAARVNAALEAFLQGLPDGEPHWTE